MGTLVQDTRLGRALEVAKPLANLSIDVSSNLDNLNEAVSHTHVEHSLTQLKDISGIPEIQPRNDYRKYNLPQRLSRNNSYFGASGIVWPSV